MTAVVDQAGAGDALSPLKRGYWGAWSVDRALRVIHALGLREARVRGWKVDLACPMARWAHAGGRDEHPSCAVLVSRDGAHYYCLSCGAHGSLLSLVWAYQMRVGRDFTEALYHASEVEPPQLPPAVALDYRVGGPTVGRAVVRAEFGTPLGRQIGLDGRDARATPAAYEPPPEAAAQAFAAAIPPTYVLDRGIARDTYRAWGLGHDEDHRRLVCPVRWPDGRLAGFTARLYWGNSWCYRCGRILEDERGRMPHQCPHCRAWYTKYWHTPGMPKGQLLYGAHLHPRGADLQAAPAPVVLVEGPLDAIALYGHGVRYAMACLGAAVRREQLDLAAQLAGGALIYACGDGDRAGQEMNAAVVQHFAGTDQPVVAVTVPAGMDPGAARAEDVVAWGLPIWANAVGKSTATV